MLLDKNANRYDGDPLRCAVIRNNLNIVNILLQRGFNPDKSSALGEAVSMNLTDIAIMILKRTSHVNRQKGEILINAVRNNNLTLVSLLLVYNVKSKDVDPFRHVPLENSLPMMNLLLQHGFIDRTVL